MKERHPHDLLHTHAYCTDRQEVQLRELFSLSWLHALYVVIFFHVTPHAADTHYRTQSHSQADATAPCSEYEPMDCISNVKRHFQIVWDCALCGFNPLRRIQTHTVVAPPRCPAGCKAWLFSTATFHSWADPLCLQLPHQKPCLLASVCNLMVKPIKANAPACV